MRWRCRCGPPPRRPEGAAGLAHRSRQCGRALPVRTSGRRFPADRIPRRGRRHRPRRQPCAGWSIRSTAPRTTCADGRRFCVSLACLEDRTPLIGVIVAPALGETYVARQGGGAMLNGTPIRAAETTALDQAVVEVGWSHRRPNADFLALCEKLLAQGATLRLGGSGTLGLARGRGRADGCLCRVAHQSVGCGGGAGAAGRIRAPRSARSWKATDRPPATRFSPVRPVSQTHYRR